MSKIKVVLDDNTAIVTVNVDITAIKSAFAAGKLISPPMTIERATQLIMQEVQQAAAQAGHVADKPDSQVDADLAKEQAALEDRVAALKAARAIVTGSL